jgi:O-antigen/teichoic acid export membrane protein
MAGGTALGQGLVILASPVLTRLYDPGDMGLFGLFSSFVGVATVGLCLRYEAAIASAPSQEEADELMLVSAMLCIPSTVVATAGFVCLCYWDVLGFGAIPMWAAWTAFPGFLFTGVWTALRYHYVRRQKLRRTAESGIVQNAGRAAIPIALAPLDLGWFGLAAGEVLGRGLSALWLVRGSGITRAQCRQVLDHGKVTSLLRKYRDFPLLALPSSALNALALALPVPLIVALYGPQDAGFFALVQSVLAVPAGIVGRSVADAFHGQAAAHARQSASLVRPFLLRVTGRVALLSLVPTVVLFLFGPQLFAWGFGSPWVVSGRLGAMMAPWIFAQIVVSPVTPIVFIVGGQRSKLLYDLSAVGVTVAALYGGRSCGLSLEASVGLLSVGYALAYGLYFLILLRLAATLAARVA